LLACSYEFSIVRLNSPPRPSLPDGVLVLQSHMTSAFVIGCGVAAGAYALKGVLHVGSKVAQNPDAMKQAAALGAGLKGAGSVFKMPSFMSFTKHAGGFDAVMNRREAALILNCRRVLPAPLASVCVHGLAPPLPPSASNFLHLPLHLHHPHHAERARPRMS
jgi:hypothetical protein